MGNLRGSTAIVGIGHAGLGSAPGWTALELLAQASARALDDAGLELKDVDGLCAATFYHFFPSLSVAEYLGICPAWSNSDMVGGSSFEAYVLQAALAIQAGLCNVVLIAYGSNARSSRNLNGLIETPPFESIYSPPIPLAGYALAASRHMHEYGTSRRDFAHVVAASRKWGKLNPEATLREEVAVEEIASAPTIADPLSRFDCCLVSDGAGAIVLTSAERARNLRKKPAYVLGSAGAHWHREISQMPDLTVTAATESGRRAYEMAGIGPTDVDVVELYDAFSINVILFLEDLGFCPKGEGGRFVSDGSLAPGGRLPVNTNGGGLSFVHPGMYGVFLLTEATTQIRGEGGARQVEKADVVLAHGNGGTLSHQCTIVLGSQTTL